MPPDWLVIVAWISVALAIICAALILGDIFLLGYRQHMWIMEAVWPITALYAGPFAVLAYLRWGRPASSRLREQRGEPNHSFAVSVGLGVSHCGAGCTLGDIIGATLVAVIGLQLAGLALWPELVADDALAFALGIAFQYYTIAPMRGLGVRDGLLAAVKADAASLTAFEVGLFGWMIYLQLVLFPEHLHPTQPTYWLMMQVGMLLGFVTAYPVNWWLMRSGVKEVM